MQINNLGVFSAGTGVAGIHSIILNAPPTIMRTLKSVIKRLDTRPAQVLVQAMIVEIDENDVDRLGIQWGTLGADTSGEGVSLILCEPP